MSGASSVQFEIWVTLARVSRNLRARSARSRACPRLQHALEQAGLHEHPHNAWQPVATGVGMPAPGHLRESPERLGKPRPGGPGRPPASFGVWVHDLRRSFVTLARRSGLPEPVVARFSGHRTAAVFKRYNIVEEQDLKRPSRC